MSELSNEPPISEEQAKIEEPRQHGAMLVTLLLLICGFLMASFMMLHYGLQARHPEGKSIGFDLAALKEKGTVYAARLKATEKPGKEEPPVQEATTLPNDSSIKNLFGKLDGKVRWPKLKLTGFGSSTDGSGGFAIINGKQVHPGQLIDKKARLAEIRSQDVVVEYMGETRTLTVDVQRN
ncbi:MAG: general secretion pathway protein GspB [Verrucomicrobiota bacterium]|nr:general secretion pathway protein GspB [Verrucomicrobiota bacterium]